MMPYRDAMTRLPECQRKRQQTSHKRENPFCLPAAAQGAYSDI